MIVNSPVVSVLMSVYNGETHLAEAIESILGQTFWNFEFIIINDGSTDATRSILNRYERNEKRISVYHQENRGLIASLNRGLGLAKGKYVARMDADDISLQDRLAVQVEFMETHNLCCAIASKVVLIDDSNHEIGYWAEEAKTTTWDDIRRQLLRSNCIAHPSIVIRTPVLREFGYHRNQINSEDYDLWLRLVSNGKRIEKIDRALLKHRVHPASVTSLSNRKMRPELKTIRTKAVFIWNKIFAHDINLFDLRVLFHLFQDLIKFFVRRIEHSVELRVKSVLMALGGMLGVFVRMNNRSSIFFFFPYCHIGGAEKVHAEIVASVRDRVPWVFFTNRSKNQKLRVLFKDKARLFDISQFTNNRFLNLILLGVLVSVINRHPCAVVFGCNNAFFYRMIPYLKPSIRRIDLLHAFGGGIEDVSVCVAQDISSRVVVNTKTLDDLKRQYASLGFDEKIGGRILLIENQVLVPDSYCQKDGNASLRIIYVGRGSKEKRTYLLGKAAAKCYKRGIPAEFTFVGDVIDSVDIGDREYCTFKGEIADPESLSRFYEWADLILLASRYEGFPMVIMEAMAHGVVPICTNVGGIPFHVTHGFNGMLISSRNEDEIVDSIVEFISKFVMDRLLLSELSHNAYKYARSHFEPSRFYASYRRLILANRS